MINIDVLRPNPVVSFETPELVNKKVSKNWQKIAFGLKNLFLGGLIAASKTEAPAPLYLQGVPNVDDEPATTEQAVVPEHAAFYLEISELLNQFEQGNRLPLLEYIANFDVKEAGFSAPTNVSFRVIFRNQPQEESMGQTRVRLLPAVEVRFSRYGMLVRDQRSSADGEGVVSFDQFRALLLSDEVDKADFEVDISESVEVVPDTEGKNAMELQVAGLDILRIAAEQLDLTEYGSLLHPFSRDIISEDTRAEVAQLEEDEGWYVEREITNEIRVWRRVEITAQRVTEEILIGDNPRVYASAEELGSERDPDELIRETERTGLRIFSTYEIKDPEWESSVWLLVPRGELDNEGGPTVAIMDDLPFSPSTTRLNSIFIAIKSFFGLG